MGRPATGCRKRAHLHGDAGMARRSTFREHLSVALHPPWPGRRIGHGLAPDRQPAHRRERHCAVRRAWHPTAAARAGRRAGARRGAARSRSKRWSRSSGMARPGCAAGRWRAAVLRVDCSPGGCGIIGALRVGRRNSLASRSIRVKADTQRARSKAARRERRGASACVHATRAPAGARAPGYSSDDSACERCTPRYHGLVRTTTRRFWKRPLRIPR